MEKISGILPLRVERGTPVLRPRGLYSPDETYVYNEQFRDYVIVQTWVTEGQIISLKDFYFLVRNRWDEIKGIRPDPSDSSPERRWEQTSKVEFIVAGSIVTDMLAANSVTADKIKSSSIMTDKLAAGAVTADKISTDLLQADKIFSMQINVNDKFKVDMNGVMTCIDGNFTGKIQSSANSNKRFVLDPGSLDDESNPPTFKMFSGSQEMMKLTYFKDGANNTIASLMMKNYITALTRCKVLLNAFGLSVYENTTDSLSGTPVAALNSSTLIVRNISTSISSSDPKGNVIADLSTNYNGYCVLRIKV